MMYITIYIVNLSLSCNITSFHVELTKGDLSRLNQPEKQGYFSEEEQQLTIMIWVPRNQWYAGGGM